MEPSWNRKKNRLIALVAILLLAYFVNSFGRGFLAIVRIKEELNRTQDRVEELRVENRRLEGEIHRLNSREYIERLAREQLGLVKEGEISVILIQEE